MDDQPSASPNVTRLRRRFKLWVAATVITFVVMASGSVVPASWRGIPAICVPLFLVSGFGLSRALNRLRLAQRRHAAVSVTPASITDDRPPVLYLRGFDDDKAAAHMRGSHTEEEHLAAVLAVVGPVVAVGRPQEALPELGA